MIKRNILIGFILALTSGFLGSPLIFAQSSPKIGTLTITTYYPSPFGVYNELRAKRMAIGDNYYDPSTHGWGAGQDWKDKGLDLAVQGKVMIGRPDLAISPKAGLGINTYPEFPIDIYGSTLTGDDARFVAGWAWGKGAFFKAPIAGLAVGNRDFTKNFALYKDLSDTNDTTYFSSSGHILLMSNPTGGADEVNIVLGSDILPHIHSNNDGIFIYSGDREGSFNSVYAKHSWAALSTGDKGAGVWIANGMKIGGIWVNDRTSSALMYVYTVGDLVFDASTTHESPGHLTIADWETMRLKPGTGADDADLHVFGSAHIDTTLTVAGKIVGADVAENFLMEKGAEPGDVMAVDLKNDERLVKSTKAYSPIVTGIVSGHPGIVVGKKVKGKNYKPLALKGRVLCKVTNEGGLIKRGDLLVSSSKPGYAMKADSKKITLPTQVIGIAMQNMDKKKKEDEVMVFVK